MRVLRVRLNNKLDVGETYSRYCVNHQILGYGWVDRVCLVKRNRNTRVFAICLLTDCLFKPERISKLGDLGNVFC